MKHQICMTTNSTALTAVYPHPGLTGRGSGLRHELHRRVKQCILHLGWQLLYLQPQVRPKSNDRPKVH